MAKLKIGHYVILALVMAAIAFGMYFAGLNDVLGVEPEVKEVGNRWVKLELGERVLQLDEAENQEAAFHIKTSHGELMSDESLTLICNQPGRQSNFQITLRDGWFHFIREPKSVSLTCVAEIRSGIGELIAKSNEIRLNIPAQN